MCHFKVSLVRIKMISIQVGKYGSEECWKELFSFLVETIETAVKSWHETSSVDARVYFLLDKEKTQTDKYAPVVNIDKVCIFLVNLCAIIIVVPCLDILFINFMLTIHAYLAALCCSLMIINSKIFPVYYYKF